MVTTISPNGAVRVSVIPDPARLRFGVTLRDRPVIETSPMVFLVDGVELTAGAEVLDQHRFHVDESYPCRGNHSVAVDRCHATTIALRHPEADVRYFLQVRAYDDAAAFRTIPCSTSLRWFPGWLTMYSTPSLVQRWSSPTKAAMERSRLASSGAARLIR